jgi:hypothetical protein
MIKIKGPSPLVGEGLGRGGFPAAVGKESLRQS